MTIDVSADVSASVSLRAVILAGGSGTRLWPLSRQALPKQFLALTGSDTLLEATVARLQPMIAREAVWIVSGEAAARGEALVHLAPYQVLLEPCARNTAPAIGIAALKQMLSGEDAVMVVLPADHLIQDVPAFQAALRRAIEGARSGKLVTFGITPDKPETGFGYIKVGASAGAGELCPVAAFKEKPDLATAQRFLAEGGYFWNAGMFVWKASAILAAIGEALPALAKVLEAIAAEVRAGDAFNAALKTHFSAAPNISIDHGVLEKSNNLFVVPANIGWSDVGSWDAVYDVSAKDAQGNVAQGNVLAVDCANTLVRSEKRLVAAVGLTDVTIVETADAILVARHGESQKVKQVVEALQQSGGSLHVEHLTVQRPWGAYTVMEEGEGFKIKRIEVKPGGRLSLQSHRFRSEHWVVVAGIATVTCDGVVRELVSNESTFIPIGSQHRLENRGEVPLQIIEVQVGSYVGEDDIQRYDDQYGRVS
ncbi:MAG: mannose-1-phosphate guanylyltransferase/mannose-6-phosphate isomerase [Betaproteobacteria bacterium]|nr:mannose-1-phosphate guanylyltransferase/mannose-6-phosphate isomerase [Betaproteobacteria bacterium]